MKKTIYLIIIIVLLWAGAFYVNNKNSTAKSSQKVEALPKVNFRAPGFTAQTLDGQTLSIKQAKGKPLIINFWASWCGPCQLEAAELESIKAKYKDKVQIYGVNLTYTENSISDIQNFAQNFGYTFPVLLDKDQSISKEYQITPIPDTFFIDKNGVIVDKILGYGGKGVLTKKANQLMSGGGSH